MAKKTITLEEPIVIGDRKITDVIIRSPKVKELRTIEALGKGGEGGTDEAVSIAIMLTNLTAEEVEELDTVDLFRVSKAMEDFFGAAPAKASGAA